MKTYTVVLTPDTHSGGYTVTVPALPGCVTDGPTIDKALERAKEAIELYLEDDDDAGLPDPFEEPGFVIARVEVA